MLEASRFDWGPVGEEQSCSTVNREEPLTHAFIL